MIRRIDGAKAYNFQNSAQRSQQNIRLTSRITTAPTLSKVKDPWNELNKPFPSSLQPLFQTEAKSFYEYQFSFIMKLELIIMLRTFILLIIFSLVETISLKIWETSVLVCEVFTSGFRPWLENFACGIPH